MYVDIETYLKVLRHVWSLRGWPGRRKMLLRLLIAVPVLTLFNSLCFLLDYLLFPRLWWQRVERPVFGVSLATAGGKHLWSYDGIAAGAVPDSIDAGSGSLDIRIDRLALMPDLFDVNADVKDHHKTRTFDALERSLRFQVTSGSPRAAGGSMVLDASMTMPMTES